MSKQHTLWQPLIRHSSQVAQPGKAVGACLVTRLCGLSVFYLRLQAFGRALAKQLLQSALMGLVFLIAMYLSGQPMPWQSSMPAAPREL